MTPIWHLPFAINLWKKFEVKRLEWANWFFDPRPPRRHIRQTDPGALTNPAKTNLTRTDAIKRYVLSHAWRDARFLHEPGRGPAGSLIGRYAMATRRRLRRRPSVMVSPRRR